MKNDKKKINVRLIKDLEEWISSQLDSETFGEINITINTEGNSVSRITKEIKKRLYNEDGIPF